jgi:hypothetical protein
VGSFPGTDVVPGFFVEVFLTIVFGVDVLLVELIAVTKLVVVETVGITGELGFLSEKIITTIAIVPVENPRII